MPGYSSALGTVAIAKQTGKGVAAAVPTVKFALTATSLMPDKRRARYASTDLGRDEGPAYTAGIGVAGDFSHYLHFDGFALEALLALGSNANAGAGPDYTHTGTPVDALPYFTLWRMVGGVVTEKWIDCKCSMLRVESGAGSPVTVTLGVVGITAEFEAADTALARLQSPGLLHMEAAGRFKFATVAQQLARCSFEVNNNVSGYQADDYAYADIDEGKRNIAFSFGTRFRGPLAFPKYRDFYYNGDAGTTLSPVVGTQAFEVEYRRAANQFVKIALPELSFAAVPVQSDPGGAPIEVEVACEVNKPAAAAIVTTTVGDQTATW